MIDDAAVVASSLRPAEFLICPSHRVQVPSFSKALAHAGASLDYLHPTGSGESYGALSPDEFNANNMPLVQPGVRRGGTSNLSRVSMSIMKELSNAEWKIDPSSLVLGKMIGKGGFGEHPFRADKAVSIDCQNQSPDEQIMSSAKDNKSIIKIYASEV